MLHSNLCAWSLVLPFLHLFPQRLSLTSTRNEFDFSNAEGNWIFLYWMHPFNDCLCSCQFNCKWPDIDLMIWLKELERGVKKTSCWASGKKKKSAFFLPHLAIFLRKSFILECHFHKICCCNNWSYSSRLPSSRKYNKYFPESALEKTLKIE